MGMHIIWSCAFTNYTTYQNLLCNRNLCKVDALLCSFNPKNLHFFVYIMQRTSSNEFSGDKGNVLKIS